MWRDLARATAGLLALLTLLALVWASFWLPGQLADDGGEDRRPPSADCVVRPEVC